MKESSQGSFLHCPPFLANQLFKPTPAKLVDGKLGFMNLSAPHYPGRAIDMEQLKGAGLYDLFRHGKLFYVGIFSGAAEDSMSGTVSSGGSSS